MSEKKRNLYFNVDNFLITILVFLRLALVVIIPFAFKALNPVGEALKDFSLTDLVFSQLRDESKVPTNRKIVIVDVGDARECDRGCIATEILAINSYKPKVVALDMFFRREKKGSPQQIANDSLLELALSQTKNLVMATKIVYDEGGSSFTDVEASHPRFTKNGCAAFVNVITDEGKKKKGQISKRTVRNFTIRERVLLNHYRYDTAYKFKNKNELAAFQQMYTQAKLEYDGIVFDSSIVLKPVVTKVVDSIHYSYPYHIVRLYDPKKAEIAKKRKKKKEIINYYGNVSLGKLKFQYISKDELLNVYEGVQYAQAKQKAGLPLDANDSTMFEGAKAHSSIFKDNIVLMGLVPLIDISDPKSLANVTFEDTYYTSLNPNYVGRTYPDMYGLIIHANVIAQMLDNNYINESPLWLNVVMAVVSTFLIVVMFTYLFNYYETVYRLGRKTVQFIIGLVLLFALVFIYHWFDYFLHLEAVCACALLSTGSMRMFYRTVRPLLERYKILKPLKIKEKPAEQTETTTENTTETTENNTTEKPTNS